MSETNTQDTPSTEPESSTIFYSEDGKKFEIREVWASNLDVEMKNIREVLEKYPYVAMDTEFPGVVAKPICEFGASDFTYQTLRCNCDMLKLIQLGLSFTDEKGNFADDCVCWQFNFKFSLIDDMFAQDSIDMLISSGINFDKFEKCGIDIHRFGELMMMSGLVLTDDVKWLSFHSGYDFGYLLRTLTCAELPADEGAFMELLHLYFPCIFDIKFMMTAVEGMHGGLNTLADNLKVERLGPIHQAGSDSLLTSTAFFAFVKTHFSDNFDESRFRGELFGLGNNYTKFKAKQPVSQYGQTYSSSPATQVDAVY
mmetsp:Transcript_26223/g.44216  ORF Transcript_26223/g.44216 Transcript_26223/m.44216 type:complete len:312 (+) Transcript_26223:85-1020(+)